MKQIESLSRTVPWSLAWFLLFQNRSSPFSSFFLFSVQNRCHVGSASVCCFLVLDRRLKALEPIWSCWPTRLLEFISPWTLDTRLKSPLDEKPKYDMKLGNTLGPLYDLKYVGTGICKKRKNCWWKCKSAQLQWFFLLANFQQSSAWKVWFLTLQSSVFFHYLAIFYQNI